MATAKYINFNQPQSFGEDSTSIFSRIKSAGSKMSMTTIIVILAVVLFAIISIFYYFYYISPQLNAKYKANHEQVDTNYSNGNTAEVLFFYADWCPHCKTAKPIWNDLKAQYENKTINGYKIVFTEINCSEETAEVEKMMNQYNVEGYPTIKLLKDGQVIEYDAKPSKDTLNQFLNTVI